MFKNIVFIFLTISTASAWNPKFYPYDPRIHNCGNHGIKGKFHSMVAPLFTLYTDATVYGRNLRQDLVKLQGENRTILDVACGTGFSTSEEIGCKGLDVSKEMISTASTLFPNKIFEQADIEDWIPDKQYDIVTMMFFFHEVPQEARLNIIEKLKTIALEKIMIVDISPNYNPSKIMLSGEPYITEYLQNIQSDLQHFKEEVIIKNHVHAWSYYI